MYIRYVSTLEVDDSQITLHDKIMQKTMKFKYVH